MTLRDVIRFIVAAAVGLVAAWIYLNPTYQVAQIGPQLFARVNGRTGEVRVYAVKSPHVLTPAAEIAEVARTP